MEEPRTSETGERYPPITSKLVLLYLVSSSAERSIAGEMDSNIHLNKIRSYIEHLEMESRNGTIRTASDQNNGLLGGIILRSL